MTWQTQLETFRRQAARKGRDITVSGYTRRYYRLSEAHQQRLAQLAALHRLIDTITRHVRRRGSTAYDDALLSLAIKKLQAARTSSKKGTR